MRIFEPSDKEEGRYRDISKLTAGGMGVVYRAYDNILDKPVAIKTLIFDSFQESMVPRFQREAVMVSKLNHQNIVSILDFGVTKQNEPYMVMDFVTGGSLETIIGKRKFNREEVIDLVSQVCRAMSHAHGKGVIHRDLKPSNILIAEDVELDKSVKIVDFGIAKLSDADEVDGRLTQFGVVVGSPLYMSPEQVQGISVDERSDIYSLGCVLYCLLTGKPPFKGNTALDTMQDHVNTAPQMPLIGDDDVQTKGNLAHVTMKCLEKDPENRYQSMLELEKDLADCGIAREVEQEAPLKVGKLIRSWNSWPAFLMLCAIVAVILIFPVLSERFYQRKVDSSKSKEAKLLPVVEEAIPTYKTADKKFIVSPCGDDKYFEFWKPFNAQRTFDSDLAVLADGKNRIRVLSLEATKITDQGLNYLVGLKLYSLNLNETGITDAGAKYIKQIKSLKSLNLSNTTFGDRGLANLDNPSLQSLSLDFCTNVHDKGLRAIVSKWPDLDSLDVSETAVTKEGMLAIADLKKLTTLNANGREFSNKFVDLVMESNLEKISLVGSKITEKSLNRLLELPSLQELNAFGAAEHYKTWSAWAKEKYKGKVKILDPRDVDSKPTLSKQEIPFFADFLDQKGLEQ